MKKAFVLLFILLLALLTLTAGTYVQDDLKLLSSEEMEGLENYFESISEWSGLYVGVHTFRGLDNNGGTLRDTDPQDKDDAYIDQYLDSNLQEDQDYFVMFAYQQGDDTWYKFADRGILTDSYGDDSYEFIWNNLYSRQDTSYYEDFALFGDSIIALVDYLDRAETTETTSTNTYVLDEAGLLSSTQLEQLAKNLAQYSEDLGYPIMVATVTEVKGKNTIDDSDLLQEKYVGINGDGVLLYVNMGTRQWNISTSGRAIQELNDKTLERLENVFLSDLSSGNYFRAFDSFGSSTRSFALSARNNSNASSSSSGEEDSVDTAFFIFVGFVVGLISAAITVGIMKKKLKSAVLVDNANDFIKPGSFKLTQHSDIFLYRHVSKTKIEKSSSSGSSTHFSSSGGSHGGRSGSF